VSTSTRPCARRGGPARGWGRGPRAPRRAGPARPQGGANQGGILVFIAPSPPAAASPRLPPPRSYAFSDGSRYGYTLSANDAAGRPIGPRAQSSWLYVAPWAFQKLLRYLDARYSRPPIFVTENGVSAPGEAGVGPAAAARDGFRVGYYSGYLDSLCAAVAQGGRVWGGGGGFGLQQGRGEKKIHENSCPHVLHAPSPLNPRRHPRGSLFCLVLHGQL
jgi:hypothetical protein